MLAFHLPTVSSSFILYSLFFSSTIFPISATTTTKSTKSSSNTSQKLNTFLHFKSLQISSNLSSSNTSSSNFTTFRLSETKYCNSQSECGTLNSICRMDTHECQCNLGYADDTDPNTFNCTRIHCTKNTQCLEDFTNVRCWNHICTCDEGHRIDVNTQTCRYPIDPNGGDSPLISFLIIFAITLGVLLLLAISIIFCLVCQQRARKAGGDGNGGGGPSMIFVPTWAGGGGRGGGDGGESRFFNGDGRGFPRFFNHFGFLNSSNSSPNLNSNHPQEPEQQQQNSRTYFTLFTTSGGGPGASNSATEDSAALVQQPGISSSFSLSNISFSFFFFFFSTEDNSNSNNNSSNPRPSFMNSSGSSLLPLDRSFSRKFQIL
ncbi:hypothetical protein TYRP_019759 [Tyrophagus putrescentiae]|nr:hypothetical protein TYRP_019759 [Tyrophagus putrescentiae]